MISDDEELILDWIGGLCWFRRGRWRISEYMRIYWMLGLRAVEFTTSDQEREAVGFKAWSFPRILRYGESVY